MDKYKCLRCVLVTLTFAASTAVATPSNEDVVFADDAGAAGMDVSTPLVTTVSNPAVDAIRRSTVEPGRHGGAELAGALVLTGFLLRAAYRRGII